MASRKKASLSPRCYFCIQVRDGLCPDLPDITVCHKKADQFVHNYQLSSHPMLKNSLECCEISSTLHCSGVSFERAVAVGMRFPFVGSNSVRSTFLTIFAHGWVTSMSLVGTPMALDHSILINLFIKVRLNIFSSTSPAKYCFCLKNFWACVWQVLWGY